MRNCAPIRASHVALSENGNENRWREVMSCRRDSWSPNSHLSSFSATTPGDVIPERTGEIWRARSVSNCSANILAHQQLFATICAKGQVEGRALRFGPRDKILSMSTQVRNDSSRCAWHRPGRRVIYEVYRCAYSQNAKTTKATIKATMPAAESASQNFAT